jgi:transcriptional regulator with XRE-family HTH domain
MLALPVLTDDAMTIRSASSIIDVLTAERKSRKLSGHTLARLIGYDHKTLHWWERKKRMPSLENAMNWAESLGYEIVMVKREPRR